MEATDIELLETAFKNGLNQYRAFARGQEILSVIKNLLQVERETSRRVDDLKTQEISISGVIESARKKASEILQKSESVLSSATEKANQLIKDADLRASSALHSANENIKFLEERIVSEQAKLSDLERRLEDTNARLANLLTEEQAVKEKMRQALANYHQERN